MKNLLTAIQIAVSLALIGLVLLQAKGSGLGAGSPGGDFYHSKRGAERVVFLLTVVLGLAFLVISLTSFIL
jgi:protein translocase SecG subunit